VSSSTTETPRPRLAILISGQGSNMVAVAKACLNGQIPADIVSVISDNAAAGGLLRARELGLHAGLVDRRGFTRDGRPDRPAFETALRAALDACAPDYVILAGFMRVLSEAFVAHYAGRMLNIHPSLLPRHRGLDTHARALAAGDAAHGASVHFVTAGLDAGPLIAQATVPVLPGDDVATLSGRVHAREHKLYPMVIEWLVRGRLRWNDGQPLLDGVPLTVPVRLRE